MGLGHTILDQLQPDSNVVNKGYVIYAPHFSFPTGAIKRPLTIGTFLWSGIPMLEYAQAHPEIKWVFKPHPKLKSELHEPYSGWTHEAVEKYYQDWERIAITCYNADYPTLFKQSAAMITDCASFLLEYAVTGKPIIRLYPNELDYYPRESIKPLFEIYYSAHNRDEMFSIFASVLEKHEDATRELRLNMLDKMQLIGINASLNIVAYITQLIK